MGIEIHRDEANGLLGLSKKAYVEKVIEKFNMFKSNWLRYLYQRDIS